MDNILLKSVLLTVAVIVSLKFCIKHPVEFKHHINVSEARKQLFDIPISEDNKIAPDSKMEHVEGVKHVLVSRGVDDARKFTFNRNDIRIPCELTPEQLEAHLRGGLKGYGEAFIRAEKENGINAVLLSSLARHESGNGSYKYMDRNNIFSWGANTDSPDDAIAFDSIEQCIDVVSKRLKIRLDEKKDWSMNGLSELYNAADPEWKMKVLNVIEGGRY